MTRAEFNYIENRKVEALTEIFPIADDIERHTAIIYFQHRVLDRGVSVAVVNWLCDLAEYGGM